MNPAKIDQKWANEECKRNLLLDYQKRNYFSKPEPFRENYRYSKNESVKPFEKIVPTETSSEYTAPKSSERRVNYEHNPYSENPQNLSSNVSEIKKNINLKRENQESPNPTSESKTSLDSPSPTMNAKRILQKKRLMLSKRPSITLHSKLKRTVSNINNEFQKLKSISEHKPIISLKRIGKGF